MVAEAVEEPKTLAKLNGIGVFIMASKVLVAFDSFYQDANSLRKMLVTAARTADHDVQVTCVSDAKEMVDYLKQSVDDVHLILSQVFAGRRFEVDALEQLRRYSPSGNIRIIIIINRPREEVSDEELLLFLRAGFFDVYFLSDVESASKLIATSWHVRTAEEAYKYLRITPPSEVRPVTRVPASDMLAGMDARSKAKRGKNFFFEAPIARSRVPIGRRRVVAVCSCSAQVGASQLALNLALAIAASGRKVAFQELPPESGYYVERLLANVVTKPIQHAALLYQGNRPPEGANTYRGVDFYYEQSNGISISKDRVDASFLMRYLLLPGEDTPAILDVGSSFFRLVQSDEVSEMITDVVIAVRSDRLKDDAVTRMERLLSAVQAIGIRPLIVFLNEEPPRKPNNLWKEYGNLLFYINPEHVNGYGIYEGGEEELSGVIRALGLYDTRVPDAPLPSAPVQMETVNYQPAPAEEVNFDEFAVEKPKTFVPLSGKPFPFNKKGSGNSENGSTIGDSPMYASSEKIVDSKVTVVTESTQPAEPQSPAAVNGMTEEERAEMQSRISELAVANNDLIAQLNQANLNIESQNKYISEQCVSRADYDVMRQTYDSLREQYEALMHSSEAAGRDRETLSTAATEAEQRVAQLSEEQNRLMAQITSLQSAITERDSSIASLQETVTGKENVIASLRDGSTAASTMLEDITKERDEQRSRIASLEQALGRAESNLESTHGEIESLSNENASLRESLSAAENAAVESRKEYERKLSETMSAFRSEADGDRSELLRELENARAEKREFESQREEFIRQAKADAERIRIEAAKEAERKKAETQLANDAEYRKLLEKQQELDALRSEVNEKRAQAAVEAERIIANANADAEKKQDEAASVYAEKAREVRKKEEEFELRMAEERNRIKAAEAQIEERREELESKENDLKLMQGMLDKQKRQQDAERKTIEADLSDLEAQKKDFVRRVKELNSQEEDVKDREARRAEKERRAIAKAEERADLHRLKMEERRKGGASGVTFFICVLILALAFGGLLYLVYRQGKDETDRLKQQITETESKMITVLVAKDSLPENAIVTMSDFVATEIKTDEAVGAEENYVGSFSGTLTLTRSLSKGQCLMVDDVTKGE